MSAVELSPYLAGLLGGSGVAVWASRRRELVARWLTWAVAAALVVGAFAAGPPGVAVLAAGLAVVAAAEYGRLVGLSRPHTVLLAAAVVVIVATAWWRPDALPRVAAAGLLAVVLVPVLRGDTRDGGHRAAHGGLGLAWWALFRLVLSTVGRLSAGIRLGYRNGFDSGTMLDYVYVNRARGPARAAGPDPGRGRRPRSLPATGAAGAAAGGAGAGAGTGAVPGPGRGRARAGAGAGGHARSGPDRVRGGRRVRPGTDRRATGRPTGRHRGLRALRAGARRAC